MTERPTHRMTLRQLMTHSEKCVHDLIEQYDTVVKPRMTEFRDLSRPSRKKSHYPTMLMMMNGMRRLQQAVDEVLQQAAYLQEHLEEIREHAKKERLNRI